MNWQQNGLVQGTEKRRSASEILKLKKFKDCDNKELPISLIPYVYHRLRRLQKAQRETKLNAIDYVYPIEHMRFVQRAQQSQQNTISVILMACQAFEPESLQATLLPYILCANAITYSTQPYRLIICNSQATKDTLSSLAIKRGVEIDLTQITFLPNINHIDILKNIISSIGPMLGYGTRKQFLKF